MMVSIRRIDERFLKVNDNYISLVSPFPLRSISSAVLGAGFGYYKNFVNRHVDKNYYIDDHLSDIKEFIKDLNYHVDDTIGMMTAVLVKDLVYRLYEHDNFSIFVVITAGVGNAVDCTKALDYTREQTMGTINTWVFINGYVGDDTLVQAITTATEAKTRALHDLDIRDSKSKTVATGTSTDSILVAATQSGTKLPYAGTATPLGQILGKAIYQETKRAILRTRK